MLKNTGLSRNWERALSGLAAVVAVTVLLSFAPVRALASEVLSVFRVERIVLLPISVSQIEDLQAVAEELGEDYFPGSSQTLVDPGEPQHPATLDEAGELAGFDTRAPANYPLADDIIVQGEMVTRFVPDVAQMQLLFQAAGLSPDLVPLEIDGQSFDFDVPTSVVQRWEGDEGLMLAQMSSPSISFPDEVDEEALGLAMLQLLGYSPEDAAALSASIDWTTTLVMPVPADQASFEEVAVDGTNGFLMSAAEDDTRAVLWQKDGIVYFLTGSADDASLLETANSLQ